ncbi:alpha/beta hydrolase [Amorphoplanes digitatis]|uniref:Enterochelin esterase family protein n=1 Tax=Actinoplanes digitatis TaxID=1868 RepID=A0A7W7HXF0_9ACTN|nr:alpha/beta hydrolase-fold protein [Actinoplanes digitatis]MBB4762550.1 enterochelin esterase family protein [Actinoplanes digitatis]GID92322.1 ferric enterobactin esterase [Actinoplanes digitatis]
MEPAVGAWCGNAEICFRLHDHEHRLKSVRLRSGAASGEFSYDAERRSWELRLPRPPVRRVEYHLELGHPDGSNEIVCDPDNPRRSGESSVLWCPDYREPDWLHLPQAAGRWREVYLPLPAVRGEMIARIWSPDTRTDRVLVAHDGPDFLRYGEIGRYTGAMIGAGRVPPYHLVLLPPGERFEWYSASPAYAKALARDVLPKLAAELGTDRPVVGAGASLGALAMLHAQRRHPERFAALFLQSGSFFQPRFDRQESGFRRYLRIVRFTGRVRRDAAFDAGVPAALTCGAVEENLANNRDMAAVLGRQGYTVSFSEVPDAHNWTGWRDALDPDLTRLLQKVFI